MIKFLKLILISFLLRMENYDKILTNPINASNDLGASSDITMHDADYLQEVEVVGKNHIQKLDEGKVPPYRAVFLIANAALGAGLLNFPQAFMKSGGIKTALSIEVVCIFSENSIKGFLYGQRSQ